MDASTSSEEDATLERTLRDIFDKHRSSSAQTSICKGSPEQINIIAKNSSREVSVQLAIAKMPAKLIDHPHFVQALEKYKVARVQYLPAKETNKIDAIIVAVTELPDKINILNTIIPITKAEDMTIEQRDIFKKLID